MHTTSNEFLDQVKARYGLPSDYALAKKIGLTPSMVSAYRNGKRMLGEEPAVKVAELLELDPGYVLACIEAERSHVPAIRQAWENLADLVKRHGAAAAVLLAAAPIAQVLESAGPMLRGAGVCILCKLRAVVRPRTWCNNPGDAIAITA